MQSRIYICMQYIVLYIGYFLCLRSSKRLPLTPSLMEIFLLMFQISFIVVPKFIVISTSIIQAPYILPLGMLLELLIIMIINSCLYRQCKNSEYKCKYLISLLLSVLFYYFCYFDDFYLVFNLSTLASVCVPLFCDRTLINLDETQGNFLINLWFNNHKLAL